MVEHAKTRQLISATRLLLCNLLIIYYSACNFKIIFALEIAIDTLTVTG